MNELWDRDAERAILSSVLLAPKMIRDLTLRAEDFADQRHGELWAAAVAMTNSGEPVDPVTIMARNPRLSEIVIGLHDAAPNVGNAGHYARIVADKATVRRLHEAATRIQQYAMSDRPVAEIAEHARSIIDGASQMTSGVIQPIGETIRATMDRLEQKLDSITSPWPDLDDIIGGFRPGALYVVGARPAVGKSLIGANLARYVGRERAVSFSSLEMSADDLNERFLSDDASVDLTRLVRKRLRDEDWTAIAKAAARFGDLPIYVDDRSKLRVIEIHARARDVSRKANLGLVVVDYLQLIEPYSRKDMRERQVADISRGLKLMARDLNVPVIALAQLNRASAQRNDHTPTLTDLRESGAIEADADAVLLLHRDNDRPEDLDVIVAKNRHGPTGQVSLVWLPHYARAISVMSDQWKGRTA